MKGIPLSLATAKRITDSWWHQGLVKRGWSLVFAYGKSCDDPILFAPGKVDHPSNDLSIMGGYLGMIPFIIETAENKRVRLYESDFQNRDAKSLNQHVVVFRGKFGDLVNAVFKSGENSGAIKQILHDLGLSDRWIDRDVRSGNGIWKFFHGAKNNYGHVQD